MLQKIIFGILGVLFLTSINTTQAVDVDLYLNIVNSFSGSVQVTGTNIVIKDNIIYTPTTSPDIRIQSNSASTYNISGDIATISGYQSNPYSIQTTISLTKTNTINQIFPLFWKGGEKLTHDMLQIFVDTTNPSIPTILSPINNSNRNNPTVISRTPSTDSAAGLKEYIILISTDQLFGTTVYYQTTTNNEQYIVPSTLPEGKLYLKILAKDEVANISESQMITICNKCTTPSNGGGGGGGGTYTPPTQPTTNIQWITIIENIENQLETTPKEDPKIGFISNILYDDELLDAYKYAYNLGITTMLSAYEANLKGKLVRKDLAKMISEYALKVVKLKPDNTLTCLFNDLEEETLETKYYTKLACKLGLMGRHADGKEKLDNFMPNEAVNRAQFGTVLSRTLFGETYNIQTGENYERYQKHLQALNSKSIMNMINTPWMIELRGRVMLMMMRSDPNYNQIQHASPK